jgi:hypothetical protein
VGREGQTDKVRERVWKKEDGACVWGRGPESRTKGGPVRARAHARTQTSASTVHHLKALAQISTTISRVLRTIIIYLSGNKREGGGKGGGGEE